MKATRLLKTMAVLAICTALALSSCGRKQGRTRGGSNGGKKTSTSEKIADNINVLAATTNWEETQKLYKRAKVDIENMVRNEVTKADLNSLADKGYCHSMDTIMLGILTSNTCSSNHQTLREIHAIRQKDFSTVDSNIHEMTENEFKLHEEMANFISSVKKNRKQVKSYKEEYDFSKENEWKNTAGNYLKKNLKCEEIKKGLTCINDGSVFKARRKDFCDKVVQLYIEADEYSSREHRILDSKIRKFGEFFNQKNGTPLTSEATKWIADLEAFEETYKNK